MRASHMQSHKHEQRVSIYANNAPAPSAYAAFPTALHHVEAPDDHDEARYEPEEPRSSHGQPAPVNRDEHMIDDRPTLRQLLSSTQHAQAPPPLREAAPPGHFDMLPPPASTHASWQALHDYAQSHASEHGYALAINTTAKNRSRIKLACVCYGQPKNTHKLTPETRVRKNRVSYKTGCKMWIEGKRVEDGTWALRVGEPGHNHAGRASEGWAVQRKRTWGVVGGRIGVGGITAKEESELTRKSISKDVADEDEEESGQQLTPSHSLERGGLVWKIVEQEMLRKGEPNQGRDRGVGRTVDVLQARLPGIHIFKRDVYNIRAQIKRARKAAGQNVGQGLHESDNEMNEAEAADDVEDELPDDQRPKSPSQRSQVNRRYSEPVVTEAHMYPQIDPSLNATSPEMGSTPAQATPEHFHIEQMRKENAELRRLLSERTNELRERSVEITRLRSQIDYMTNMVLSR